jgi:hypothetical protein
MDITTIIGLGLTLVISFFISQLKSKKVYYSFFIIAGFLSFFRLTYGDNLGIVVGFRKLNTADFLYSPLIYLFFFQILRVIFIELFKKEPAFGAGKFSNFDKKENRLLTPFDYAVEIIPLIIAIILPYILAVL